MLILIITASMIFGPSSPVIDIIILLYFLYPFISRKLIARNHQNGKKLFKSGSEMAKSALRMLNPLQ